MARKSAGVRPTRRCLRDLAIPTPDLGTPLDELPDPVVVAAQAIPEVREAGGAERVLSLSDRVWFKVKTGNQRAVVTELRGADLLEGLSESIGRWWVGASGRRQGDSPQRDFYASIARECTTGRTVSTLSLLPAKWDWDRLGGEQSIAWRREMKRIVVHLIALSLKTGQLTIAEFHDHRIKALVRADNGHEGYLAIVAEGIPDPKVFALLLDCVPGVSAEDWQPEPSPLAEMDPAPGEIIWSTLFPPEVATTVLELDEGNA